MARSEKAIQNEGLVALSAQPDSLYYRNNTGQAWQGTQQKYAIGQYVRVEPRMVILTEARPVNFGLPGSADVHGVQQGVAVAVEFKTPVGRQSDQQKLFERAWVRVGGVYVLARSPEEAADKVNIHITARLNPDTPQD